MNATGKSIIAVLLLVTVMFGAPGAAAGEKIRFTLPVRVFDGNEPVAGLQTQDFHLTVNNREQEIATVTEITAELGQKPEFLGRNFVLSFQLTDYGNYVQEAISYFVTEILSLSDALVLVTPLKTYKITVSANKERISSDIEALVKEDCGQFKKKLEAATRSLEIQIDRLMNIKIDEDTVVGLTENYKTIGMFLANFTQELLNFMNQYLYPGVERNRQVLDLLGNREGQGWWIHFQQGDSYGIMGKVSQVVKKIDSYCTLYEVMRPMFQTPLAQLEKVLQLGKTFPEQQLMEAYINDNIRYNTLLWEQHKPGENLRQDVIIQLEAILNRVSRETGGKSIYTVDPEKGMRSLREHSDHYYELAYDTADNGEERTITIAAADPGKKFKFSYKSQYSREEILALARYLSEEKPEIADFSLTQGKVNFSVTNLKQNKDNAEAFGLVKVRVQLLDPQGNQAFRTENTLRSTRAKVTVTIPLPARYKGKFNVVITACDLIANRLIGLNREILLL